MPMHRIAVSLLLVAPLIVTSYAADIQQSNSRPPSDHKKSGDQEAKDNIQLRARLVSLTVTVSDPPGRFVTGLTQRNFEVYDDGVKQEIAHFSDEDAPITLG